MQKIKKYAEIMGAMLIPVLIISVLSFSSANALSYASSLDIVQVMIQPTNSTISQYSVYVYNSSGQLVAQSSSNYPIVSFGLPNGTYLITASAGREFGPLPLASANGITSTSPILSSTNGSSINAPAMIIPPYRFYQEYGYALASINSSTTIVIKTSPPGKIPLYNLDVSVTMPDGSPAASADVYASPVAAYGWWYAVNQSEIKMWGQTDQSGHVTLTVPELPIQLTAWLWLPIKLPSNMTTITVKIAGELINVSVYYQPQSVGFTGSSLIIPPQNNAKIVLHYQPQNYWVYAPAMAQSPVMGSAQQAIPSSVYQSIQNNQPPSSIPSFQTLPSSQQPSQNYYYWIIIAAIAAIAASALVIRRIK
jgi:hypothetical protein